MSKPVKKLITDSYRRRFEQLDGAVLVDLRGVSANQNNDLRSELGQRAMRVTVLKNSLALRAFADTAMEPINGLLDGGCALVYGGTSVVDVARILMEAAKVIENLDFRGALMECQIYGPDQVEALSKLPTTAEARANAVQIVLSPGHSLVGSVLGPGHRIASLVSAVAEKRETG